VLIIFLREIGFSDRSVGLFLSATLLGDVLLSLFVTWTADAFGRRRMLALGSLLMCGSGVAFALSRNYIVLLVSAIVGIVSPSGNETGPFAALEQAMLSGLTEPDGRVSLLMWYQVLGFLGISVGNNLTGVIIGGMERYGKTPQQAYRAVFAAYAAIAATKVVISFLMTRHAEVDRPRATAPAAPAPSAQQNGDSERQPLLQGQRREANPILDPPAVDPTPAHLPVARLVTLCLIFALDSFASGLAPLSFISYDLRTVHAAPVNLIAHFFSVTAIIACVSQLAAASISKRLGIIGTMVGTHGECCIEGSHRPLETEPPHLGQLRHSSSLSRSAWHRPSPSRLPSLRLALSSRRWMAAFEASVPCLLCPRLPLTLCCLTGAFLAAVIPNEQRTRFLGSTLNQLALRRRQRSPFPPVTVINVVRTLATTPGPTFSLTLVSMGHIRWSFVLMGSIKILCTSKAPAQRLRDSARTCTDLLSVSQTTSVFLSASRLLASSTRRILGLCNIRTYRRRTRSSFLRLLRSRLLYPASNLESRCRVTLATLWGGRRRPLIHLVRPRDNHQALSLLVACSSHVSLSSRSDLPSLQPSDGFGAPQVVDRAGLCALESGALAQGCRAAHSLAFHPHGRVRTPRSSESLPVD
jgi:MFS family permease